ncbi:MAG TPA: glycerate kinase [Bacteroidales bacterium]|jgi:hydroxypyruvate reductase/glycerate 2-kinase|nr:glycerate kinase [Bacteroidales bacterium]
MNGREAAQKIFLAGVRSVLPGSLMANVMSLKDQTLFVGGHEIPIGHIENIFVIGAGKASAAMGHYVETTLGDRIKGGHIVVKYGHSCKLKRIEVTEAGHPVPDSNGFRATGEIIRIAANASENDLVICLISGGGSALMADLPDDLLPEELYIVNNLLVRCGAAINEINCVRKHLSKVKGGQLARIVRPASLLTLIISDVIGNPPEVIASGPTVPDPSTFREALDVIMKYNLASDVTSGVMNYLREGAAGNKPETPKPGDHVFDDVLNIIAGTNQNALKGAKAEALKLGYRTYIIDDSVQGDVESVSEMIVSTAVSFKNNADIPKPVCLLFGGETTIRVTGEGQGGRNQHLALTAALRLNNLPGITILAAGTDGNDGNTDAAGAVVDSGTVPSALSKNIDPAVFISEFDSYSLFRKEGGLIVTGPTFTNVMDLMVVVVE